MTQGNRLSFAGQNIYCGIDVHKANWAVNLRNDDFELKTFSQPPNPEILADYLKKNYPEANYYAVYEAGFTGFWTQRSLEKQGIICKVTHPADVPSTDKERQQKTDKVDCRKLSLSLKEGRMEGIFIPSEEQVDDRNILRTRQQLVKDQTRCKNRIISMLDFYGIAIPTGYKESSHFSKRFIGWLEALDLRESAKVSLQLKLGSLNGIRAQLLVANRHINKMGKSPQYKDSVGLLRSIPGIGLLNAMIFLTELGDVKRFSAFDKLCSYVGLTPNVYSSAETNHVTGITHRCNHILREALIESSWCAVRKDPALLMSYNELKKRMNYNKAIIKIGKKLLNRIRYIMLNRTKYVTCVVN